MKNLKQQIADAQMSFADWRLGKTSGEVFTLANDEIIKLAICVLDAALDDDWQPIETASRDGSIFLATNGEDFGTAVGYFGHDGDLFVNGTLKRWDNPASIPTHWKPLESKVSEILKEYENE